MDARAWYIEEDVEQMMNDYDDVLSVPVMRLVTYANRYLQAVKLAEEDRKSNEQKTNND